MQEGPPARKPVPSGHTRIERDFLDGMQSGRAKFSITEIKVQQK